MCMEIFQPSWRGRCINSRKDSNGRKYTAMIGNKSLLYIPVNVLPNAVYKVTLELCRESGNGLVYCNIYGNRNFDFPQSKINCETGNWTTFDVDVITKDFPKTVPMVFRIWRSKESTGTILVRRIVVELKEGEIEEANLNGQIISMENKGATVPNPAEYKHPAQQPAQKRLKKPKREKEKRIGQIEEQKKEKKEKRRRKKSSPVFPTRIDVATPPPKVLPIVIGEDNIKVSVILSIYNRIDLFKRSLDMYSKQSMPKEEFELVIIDDQSTDDILELCKKYSKIYNLQFQYILIDKDKGVIKPGAHTPALSNNIGIKHSRGSVLVITGPETLVRENSLEVTWEVVNKGYCLYGDIFRSSDLFVRELEKIYNYEMNFDDILLIPGAKHDASVMKGWWWYYMAARKENFLAINGVDENFMRGVSGEDDDIALRMSFSGVPLLREHNIVGIHQDHTKSDKNDFHNYRFDRKEWKRLRTKNTDLLHEWIKHKDPVANKNIDWGTEKAIMKKETF